jgi:hypothetical protein
MNYTRAHALRPSLQPGVSVPEDRSPC